MIVHMISNTTENFPEGAYCPFGPGSYNQANWGIDVNKSPIVLHETHHGLCLFESERNGYHDSDFFMTVWDPEKQAPSQILFATTRGWTYPCYASHPDATEEVLQAYATWKTAYDRRCRIQSRWNRRTAQIKKAREMGITRKQLRRLEECFTGSHDETSAIIHTLLKTKKFRSNFRQSCAEQVRKWLSDPNPKYCTPLTRKQLQYL